MKILWMNLLKEGRHHEPPSILIEIPLRRNFRGVGGRGGEASILNSESAWWHNCDVLDKTQMSTLALEFVKMKPPVPIVFPLLVF